MVALKELVIIAAAIIFPNLGSIWGGIIVRHNLDPWFHSLNQPSWNPPDWVFAPVWAALYCSMGFASYLVYREVKSSAEGFDRDARLALILYIIQLILNWAWVPIFFGLHSLKWSYIEGIALTLSATACGIAFHRIHRVAGWIFAPYVAWLIYATCLNYKLYIINPFNQQQG